MKSINLLLKRWAMPPNPLPLWLRVFVYGLAYYLLAGLGRALSVNPLPLGMIWAPSGLFVAALLLDKRENWTYYVLASVLANLAFDVGQGDSWPVSLLMSLAYTLEALTGAWLVRRFVPGTMRLNTPIEVLALTGLSAVISTGLGAVIGGLALSQSSANLTLWSGWQRLWSADLLGVLVAAPFLICLPGWKGRILPGFNRPKPFERALVYAMLVGLVWASYWQPGLPAVDLRFLIIPMLLWAAVRFGPHGSSLAVLVLALFALPGLARQTPSFNMTQALASAQSLQIFIGINAFVTMLMAAVTAQKARIEWELIERERNFRALADNAPDLVYQYRFLPTPGFDYVNPIATQMVGYTPEEHLADPQLGLKLVHPDDLEKLTLGMSSPDTLNGPLLLRWLHKDGSVLWVEQRNVPIYNESGQIVAIQGRARDITEKIHQETSLRESEARYRSFIEQSAEGFMLTDETGTVIEANQQLLNILGLTREQMIGTKLWEMQYERATEEQRRLITPESIKARYEEILSTGQSSSLNRLIETPFIDSSGSERWMQQVLFVMPSEHGYRLGGIARDITDRKVLDSALMQANEELHRSVAELRAYHSRLIHINQMNAQMQVCATISEAQAVIASVLPELFAEQRGLLVLYNPTDHMLETVIEWGGTLERSEASAPVNGAFPVDDCWAMRLGKVHETRQNSTFPICKHIKAPYPVASICVPLIVNGETLGMLHLDQYWVASPSALTGSWPAPLPGIVSGFQPGLRELVEMVAESIKMALANIHLRETMREEAIRDPLTGLYNRRYMEESFERQLLHVQNYGEPLCVLMLDIDHFKHYNDVYSHAAGDMLLRELSYYLTGSVRKADIICRYGGEEFLIILPGISLEEATARAEQMRQKVKDLHLRLGDQHLGGISVSVGLAHYPLHTHAPQQLIQMADEALLNAKSSGRDRVAYAG